MIMDATLLGLLADRTQLLKQLSVVLTRAGSHTPKRKQINKDRAKRRKVLRKSLRINSEAIASRCMEMRDEAID